MAMNTKRENKRASLKRRVQQFYELLNKRDFDRCHQMIDPRVRQKPSSVTLFQYENALSDFMAQCGSIKLLEMSLSLHLDEPSQLYEGRDFAVGKTNLDRRCWRAALFLGAMGLGKSNLVYPLHRFHHACHTDDH